MFWRKTTSKAAPTPQASLDSGSPIPAERKLTPGYYPGLRIMDQQNFWDAATRKVITHRVTTTLPIRFFTPAEAATMEAIVNRILPQDDREEATRIPLLPWLDERLHENRIEGYRYEDMPSDQEAYRIACNAIDSMAQELYSRPFHDLLTIQQEEILQSLHDDKPLAAEGLWQKLNLKRFWTMLVSDCCAVYYAHPNAWDEIGFGGPAYPRGYMRLEGGAPEPWEVEEQRYEWVAPDDTLSDRPQKSTEDEAGHSGQAGIH